MNVGTPSCPTAQTRSNISDARYSAVLESLYHPDLGQYSAYGIQVAAEGLTYILHDVSLSESEINSFVDKINCHKLSPLHLLDVVSDMLP